MNKSDSIKNIAAALAAAQSEIEPAIKDKKNPHFKSMYASLEAIWDAAHGPLNKHGISIIQLPCMVGEKPGLETMLVHSSGEFISNSIAFTGPKLDPQGIGTAITYYRRYGVAAALGIPQKDDDGNAASGIVPAKHVATVVHHNDQPPLQDEQFGPANDWEGFQDNPFTAVMPLPVKKPVTASSTPTSEYKITFGKFRGLGFADVPTKELINYADYLEKQAVTKNEKLSHGAADLINRVHLYVAQLQSNEQYTESHDHE